MASGALLVAGFWFGCWWLLDATGVADVTPGTYFLFGVLFLPGAVLTAFGVGTVLWRSARSGAKSRRRAAMLGVVTALSSYVGGWVGSTAVMAIGHATAPGPAGLVDSLVYAGVIAFFASGLALLLTGWVAVLAGAWIGWRRAGRQTPDAA